MRINKALFTLLFLTNFMSATPALAANYTFTDLGNTFTGLIDQNQHFIVINDFNNSGQFVGFEVSLNNSSVVSFSPFFYNNGNIQDLGTLGGTIITANGINNGGQVVGESSLAGETGLHAYIYSNGTMQDIGTLGSPVSRANRINDSGQVVGGSGLADGTSFHAFLYSSGSMQDLGTLGGPNSEATNLNNSGQVVGHSSLTGFFDRHAFLYSNGNMQDLGTLGGSESYATDINDNGQVVGNSNLLFQVNLHAFIYNNGNMQDLGTLGGDSSYATAINNSGQVVGYSGTEFNETHAFLYSNGNMSDLNSFLDIATLDAGWELTTADVINDNGWIVGTAYNRITNQTHAYLLSVATVPEPESYAMLLAGLGLIGFVGRRNQVS